MNGDTLFEALSHVGADLIDRACENPASDRPKKARHPLGRRLAAIAGCACFLLVGSILFAQLFPFGRGAVPTDWKEYQTLFVSGSNNEASPNSEAEVDYGVSGDYFIKEKMSDRTVRFDDSDLTGSYLWSIYEGSCSFVTDYYETEEGYEFGLKSGTNDLVAVNLMASKAFFDTEPYLDDVENASAVAEQIADRYAAVFCGDIAAYMKQVNSFTRQKEKDGKTYEITYYDFTYAKEVCGFVTSDQITIRVTSKGHLAMINTLDIGAFKNADIQIDTERLNTSVDEKAHTLYDQTPYTVNEVSVQDQRLMVTPDGYYCVASNVRVKLSNDAGNYETMIRLYTILRKK